MSHIMNGDKNVWPCVLGGVVAGGALALAAAHIFPTPAMCQPAATKPMPSKLTLMYFDGRGLAEATRQLLALAGVDYTDKRYKFTIAEGDGPIMSRISKPEMDKDQAAGVFDANMGRLPILQVDGVRIGGSKAINRYVSKAFGLMGQNSLHEAQIDNICELVFDLAEAFSKESDKDKWFSGAGTKQGDRQLQWYLQSLEKVVGVNGHAVGDSFSMADAMIYNKLGENAKTKGLFGDPDSQPMGDGAKVAESLAKFAPKVANIVKTFAASPAIRAYLTERNKTTPWF